MPQKITNLSYVVEGSKSTPTPITTGPLEKDSYIPGPPVALHREQIHRVIALVVDDMGLSFTGVAYVRAALKKFVGHDLQPGDMVAILRTSGGVGALQQFTTDQRLLYAAIDQVKVKFMARGAASFGASNLARTLEPPTVGPGKSAATSVDGPAAFKSLQDSDVCLQEVSSSIGSLAAIRYVIRGLRDLPGRKALVLFSEKMQLAERPDRINDRSGQGGCDYSQVRDMGRKLADSAERSAVVIYTVDPHGLSPLVLDASSDPFAGGPMQSSASAQGLIRGQEKELSDANFWSRGGLQYLADETGGTFAFHNDIVGAIRDAVSDSGNYYLIGYHPPANTFEAKARTKFHKVTVKVKRFGLEVRSRTGFYGFPGQEDDDRGVSREQQLAHALVSPFVENDIHLRMTAFFSQWEKPRLTTMVYFSAKDLTFTRDANGSQQAVLDVVAMAFDENGKADVAQRTYTFRTTDKDYELAVKNGVILKLPQVIRKPGPYQVRVAVRDAASQKMGSANQFVEIPNLKQGRLALSGIALQQLDAADKSSDSSGEASQAPALDPKGNVAIRIFRPGEKIGWYFQILNAKNGPDQQASLKVQVRLFRDGSEITRSEPTLAHLRWNPPSKQLVTSGHMLLSSKFVPGDYALQLIVTDLLAKKKYATASQWIDFEVENP